jgi:hypothetical protein
MCPYKQIVDKIDQEALINSRKSSKNKKSGCLGNYREMTCRRRSPTQEELISLYRK